MTTAYDPRVLAVRAVLKTQGYRWGTDYTARVVGASVRLLPAGDALTEERRRARLGIMAALLAGSPAIAACTPGYTAAGFLCLEVRFHA